MDYLLIILLLIINPDVAAGVVGTSFISEFLKYVVKYTVGKNSLTKRPEGHGKCGKSTINEIGMPSGHSMVAGYLFTETSSELRWLLLAVPMSRVVNGCHTIPQVIVGFVLGTMIKKMSRV